MRLDQSIFNIQKPSYIIDQTNFHLNGEQLYYDLTESVEIIEANIDTLAQSSYYLGN